MFVSKHLFLLVWHLTCIYMDMISYCTLIVINKLIAVQDRHHFKNSECYQAIKAVATWSHYYNK